MDIQQELLNKIVLFCENNEKIIALVLIGSQARIERHADQYYDLDLIMVVDEVDYFILSNDWLVEIEKFHITFIEPAIYGQTAKRVLFENTLDADFVIIPREQAQQVLESDDAISILSRGYQVLVNKGGFKIPELAAVHKQGYKVPTEAEYTNIVNDFWYHAIWTTKKLMRGELWAAKFCLDSYMKWKLLWIIEQYELAIHGVEYSTWYGGRFIDSWAEDDIKSGLAKSFAHYNKTDIISALTETMYMFRTLAIEVAKVHGFEYPFHADEYSNRWVQNKIG